MPSIGPGTGASAWKPTALELLWGQLYHWWDFSDLSTITASGGTVSRVEDKSGNGRALTASGSNQPTLSTMSGLPALYFDGTDDYMTASSGMGASQPFTMIGVGLNLETGGTQRDMGTYSAAAGFDGRIFRTTGGLIAAYAGNTVSTGVSWGSTRPHVCGFVYNTTSSVLFANNVRATGSVGGNYIASTFTLGAYYTAAEFWKGYIGEWMGFKGAVPEPLLVALCQALAAKWQAPQQAGSACSPRLAFL